MEWYARVNPSTAHDPSSHDVWPGLRIDISARRADSRGPLHEYTHRVWPGPPHHGDNGRRSVRIHRTRAGNTGGAVAGQSDRDHDPRAAEQKDYAHLSHEGVCRPPNAQAHLRANQIERERSELPSIAHRVQRSLGRGRPCPSFGRPARREHVPARLSALLAKRPRSAPNSVRLRYSRRFRTISWSSLAKRRRAYCPYRRLLGDIAWARRITPHYRRCSHISASAFPSGSLNSHSQRS